MSKWDSLQERAVRNAMVTALLAGAVTGVAARSLRRRRRMPVQRVGEVPNAAAGAHPSGAMTAYVRRDAHSRALRQLRETRTLLITGPVLAGKTRLAIEVAREAYPHYAWLRPAEMSVLRSTLPTLSSRGGVLVWLDDLERFLGAGGLTTADLDRVEDEPVVIIATLSEAAKANIIASESVEPASAAVVSRLPAVQLDVWSPTELSRVEAVLPEELAEPARRYGLSEFLAGGPSALDKFLLSEREQPIACAMVRACIDWHRGGMTKPLSRDHLRELAPLYLDHVRALSRREFDDALDWASAKESPQGPEVELLRVEGVGVQVHNFLLDQLADSLEPVPEEIWELLLRQDPAHLLNVGVSALTQHRRMDLAIRAWQIAASSGRADARMYLGLLRQVLGDFQGAERELTLALELPPGAPVPGVLTADAYLDALMMLGHTLVSQDRPREAERPLQIAVENGHAGARLHLGLLLSDRGEVQEAEALFRSGASTGDPRSSYALSVILEQRGERSEARHWTEAAARGGVPEGMLNLGVRLEGEGNLVDAELWYQKAADAGNVRAMTYLGLLAQKRGDSSGADLWYREAAAMGDVDAMTNLGFLLQHVGALSEAEEFWTKAAKLGHPGAITGLGLIATKRGDTVKAEVIYRDAADQGIGIAALLLGQLLEARGDLEGARLQYQAAADAGVAEADAALHNVQGG